MIIALVVLGLGVVETTRRAALTLRVLLTGRRAGTTASMWAESFETTPWGRTSSAAWAALWPAEADPWTVQPQLYVPIEDPDAPIVLESPVTVMGRPAPRGFVVILHGDRGVWPRGRARPDPPLGAAVDDGP